tara:strand:+ start:626 stop:1222 length:597 start_codon:yes stop_codon:yes gene_type:complete
MNTPGYIWFDAEFSSLELDEAVLLQVAAVITDINLNPFRENDNDIELIIKLDKSSSISPWVNDNLSDLIQRCSSSEAIMVNQADIILEDWIKGFFGKPNKRFQDRPILAGNSVHNDWFMIRKFLPNFNEYINYRLLDVSAFKIGWNNWLKKNEEFDKNNLDLINSYYPGKTIKCLSPHDALFDIKASIAELSYYKKNM